MNEEKSRYKFPRQLILNLFLFYKLQKKYSAVKSDCSKALELNPKYTKALLRRAQVNEELHDLEGALEDVTAVCILERFSNQRALIMADRVLKELGKNTVLFAYCILKNLIS